MTDVAVSLDPNQVSPGLLGFIIVCILGVCVWLLCRNMGKHLTKLDTEYRAEQETAEAAAAALAVPAQSGARPAGKAAKPNGPTKTRPTKA
ncbi:MAG TPA: hypothetical protein VH372_14795 [Actinospica sp.]|nr:hypothetical protein [Actinospica sp.]